MSADTATVDHDAHQRAGLWQRRLFEAESGLTRFFIQNSDDQLLDEWLKVKAEIFAGIPAIASADEGSWQQVFFRGQALMERFLVGHYGHERMADWALANAEVYAATTAGHEFGAAAVAGRFRRQLDNYQSDTHLTLGDSDTAQVTIARCGIWEYRERARARGVPITLASPCEYCTKATTANFAAKGYRSRYTLVDDDTRRGCRWTLHPDIDTGTVSATA
ncbi:hypothetical protein [Nocardia africana]|uniref:Uncharacterized protein n=1 Tax=Nocardia africana TaxID=134964 RepID=A0ABW6NCN2_9NOCA